MRTVTRTRLVVDWVVDGDGCLLWPGRTLPRNGYGQVNIHTDGAWKVWLVHRRVFFEYHGWLPDVVMHRCDKPACGRISCLMPGTQADNVADMVGKGRQALGAGTGHAKLTEQAVAQIRRAGAGGPVSQRALAAQYGVSPSQISRVLSGHDWKQVRLCA